jgi:hypothetical protein
MTKRQIQIELLRSALAWALERVSEKYETAAGMGCLHCGGVVQKADNHGTIHDKVTHKDPCPWVEAHKLLEQTS